MTTRAQARGAIRDLLNDAGSPPLWPDSALNAALSDAVARYGAWRPLGTRTSLSITTGSTAYVLPAAVDPDRSFQIYDEYNSLVPEAAPGHTAPGPGLSAGVELAWWTHAGSLYLTRDPGRTATWYVHHFTGRTCPSDDVTQLPIVAGEEPIVYQLAAAQLIERRALDDAKHQSRAQSRELAEYHRRQATELMEAYRRRARGGSTVN